MNTLQLDSILKSDPHCAEVYRGTFARDDFPKNATRQGLYICNTDKKSEPGTHWISCYLTGSGDNIYFDSFGLPPYLPEFETVLVPRANSAVQFNNSTLQSADTVTCGHYCLIFCLLTARGFSLEFIVSLLNDAPNSHIRDHAVERFISKLFPLLSKVDTSDDTIHIQSSRTKCQLQDNAL